MGFRGSEIKMYWEYFGIIFLSFVTIIEAQQTCTIGEYHKTRTFQTLVQYQRNSLSFNPQDGNYVNFSFNKIERLERNVFVTFSSNNVIGIDLSNKGIREIAEEAFFELDCLHYLDLSNNQILNLTKKVFQDLGNLRTLNLRRNNLTNLTENVFSNLKNIQILDISHNNISQLDYAFANISTLEQLVLSYNSMKKINYPYFSQLINLKRLYLDHNDIAVIPTFIFNKNLVLETLDLSGNMLVLFDMRNDLGSMRSIKNLNLSDNYLITLQVDIMSDHFPNSDLTIDFNNNQFYCSSWEQYLKEFKEKHIKIAPGRNFSQVYYIDGIACDTLNFSLNGDDSVEDSNPLNTQLKKDDKQYGARLNNTYGYILRELNHTEGELFGKRAKYKAVDVGLGQHGDPTTPSNHKKVDDESDHRTIIGVSIFLVVIGLGCLVLLTSNYVLGKGFMIRMRWRLRRFVVTSPDDEHADYVTLTPPS